MANSEKPSEIIEKSSSERLAEIWSKLNRNQKRYVIACVEYPIKKDAALAIGIEPQTAYAWPHYVNEAVDLVIDETVEGARGILKHSVAKAAMVKASGLDSDDEKTRQAAATEIIDRLLGKASQPMEHTGKDKGPIEIDDVTLTNEERIAKLAAIFDAARTRGSGPATESD